jgi:CRP/FNR family transcriptional regulator, dissimilatory nitrate respiration regulator
MSEHHLEKVQRPDVTQLLATHHLFAAISDDRRAKMYNTATTSNFPKGKVLFSIDDTAHNFYVIHSGWIKLYRETLDGAQAVTDILPAGQVFGEMALFNNFHYPYSAQVIENCCITSFFLKDLDDEINDNPKLGRVILDCLAHGRIRQDRELEHRTLLNAPQRIGCFLLRLIPQTAAGPVTLHLPYDKIVVASRLGMQPETFSRALTKLREETNITVHGATLIIPDIKVLSDFTCRSCSSEFPCKDICKQ